MKQINRLFLIILILIFSHATEVESRPYQEEVTAICNEMYPSGSVGILSICENAVGTCIITHMQDRSNMPENLFLKAIDACVNYQGKDAVKYSEWAQRNGVLEMQRKVVAGAISQKGANRDRKTRMATECRVSSKREGYTNYVKMWDCVENNIINK